MTACTICSSQVQASETFISAAGPLCGTCHSDQEIEEGMQRGWVNGPNIFTALLLFGGLSLSFTINGIDLAMIVIAPLMVGAAVWMFLSMRKDTAAEPGWLRIGRPVSLLLVGLWKLLLIFPSFYLLSEFL